MPALTSGVNTVDTELFGVCPCGWEGLVLALFDRSFDPDSAYGDCAECGETMAIGVGRDDF